MAIIKFQDFMVEKGDESPEPKSIEKISFKEFNILLSKFIDHELAEIEKGEESHMKDTVEKIKAFMIDNNMYKSKDKVELKEENIDEKLTDEAKDFISKKIEKLHDEGYEGKQAVAMAYEYARKEGFKIPKK